MRGGGLLYCMMDLSVPSGSFGQLLYYWRVLIMKCLQEGQVLGLDHWLLGFFLSLERVGSLVEDR